MKEVLDKITSYNLFNYLLSGVLFVMFLEKFTVFSLIQEDLITGAFVYYFVGLVISRFGSLVIEPVLKRTSFLRPASYSDFISASKSDQKIESLSETNNMYRTFVAMVVLLLLLKAYELFSSSLSFLSGYSLHILLTILLIMFLLSYRKQTQYITKRINANKS